MLANIPATLFDMKDIKNTEMWAFYAKSVVDLLFSLDNSYKNQDCFLFKLEKHYTSKSYNTDLKSFSKFYFKVTDFELLDDNF